jgi:hypothetical protein
LEKQMKKKLPADTRIYFYCIFFCASKQKHRKTMSAVENAASADAKELSQEAQKDTIVSQKRKFVPKSSIVIGLCKLAREHKLQVGDDVYVQSTSASTTDGHYYKDGSMGEVSLDVVKATVVHVTADEIKATTYYWSATYPCNTDLKSTLVDASRMYTHFVLFIFKYDATAATWFASPTFGSFSSRNSNMILTEDQMKAIDYYTDERCLQWLVHVPGQAKGSDLPTL